MVNSPVFVVSELGFERPDDPAFESMVMAQEWAITSSFNDAPWGIWRDYMGEQELVRIVYGQEVFEK